MFYLDPEQVALTKSVTVFPKYSLSHIFCPPIVGLPVTHLQSGPQRDITFHSLTHSQPDKAYLGRPVSGLSSLAHWSSFLALFIIVPNNPLLCPHLYTQCLSSQLSSLLKGVDVPTAQDHTTFLSFGGLFETQ